MFLLKMRLTVGPDFDGTGDKFFDENGIYKSITRMLSRVRTQALNRGVDENTSLIKAYLKAIRIHA